MRRRRCVTLPCTDDPALTFPRQQFDILNNQLIEELPVLLDQRIPFFDPSFEAMIRIQAKFAEEAYEKMSGVQR